MFIHRDELFLWAMFIVFVTVIILHVTGVISIPAIM